LYETVLVITISYITIRPAETEKEKKNPVHPANVYLTASLQDYRYNGNPFPVTEVTGFTM
jgi:hypothetical protein